MTEIPHEIVVSLQICEQLRQPFFPLVIGGDESFHPEWVYVAYFVDIDCPVYTGTYVIIGSDDIGDLQSGDIERLAGRIAVTE